MRPSHNRASVPSFIFGNTKYIKARRRSFCCILLAVLSVLATHQGVFLGGIHSVIFDGSNAVAQHVSTGGLVDYNVTLSTSSQRTKSSNNNLHISTTNGANMHISSSSTLQRSQVRKWHNRVVFLHKEGHREVQREKKEEKRKKFRQELPRMRTWNSLDHAILPPKPVEFVPINVTTGQIREGSSSEECKTNVAPWQKLSFPNCNVFHELDFVDDVSKFLSNGEYRDVWKISLAIPGSSNSSDAKETLVLKTLRTSKGFSPHRLELHRLDALVTERLSSSPHVANIYGYCGQSTINELARQTGTVLRRGRLSAQRKLQYAIDVANAIANLHDMDRDGRVSLVHRDIKVSNFLISKNGEHLFVHDFNCARLMASGSPCGFYKPECVQNRSPEECMGQYLTEKIDVYSMGNVLYAIVASYLPYTFPRVYTEEEFSQMIINGTTPQLPDRIARSQHPVNRAIVRVMEKCFAFNPSHRPSAREIALELQRAYDVLYAPSSY